jgi:prepilin-type N-terminal cleavage/methylation domain-containing protein
MHGDVQPHGEVEVPQAPGPAPRRAAGFTLLEVLIALAILSVNLTSLLSSQVEALHATEEARQISTVAFLAESKLMDIEWELKREGWGSDDKTFEGDFSAEGWPEVRYLCTVDIIEMPEFSAMMQAKEEAETDGFESGLDVQSAGETAFGSLGMVWPIVKEAIEQALRKSWCTVRWTPPGRKVRGKVNGPDCLDSEQFCLTVVTFWTDPAKLQTLPSLGGEVDEGDDSEDGDDGRGGGDKGGGGGRPGEGGGSGRPGGGGVNPNIPRPGGSGFPSGGGMGPGGGR